VTGRRSTTASPPASGTQRPRVLRIITRLNVGGPATHVVLADRGLRARGWETLLVHGSVEPDEAEIDLEGVEVPRIRVTSLGRAIDPVGDGRTLVRLVSLIRRYRPDIIHTHLSKAGLLGRIAAMLASPAPRVHTFHGTIFGGYFGGRASQTFLTAERLLARRTDRIVALSRLQEQELLDHRVGTADRIRIVPLGLDLGRFGTTDRESARARLGIPNGIVMILAIGRLVPIKRLDRLVRAFSAVVEQHPEARLYIVGGGSERAPLERLVRAFGLESVVVFAGWSSDGPDWYAAADLVALTSDREGTPLALIEAAAAARAVVATDAGAVADIVIDGQTGFVVPLDRDDILEERLAMVVQDADLRRRLGESGPARATAWTADRLVDDLDRLYREVLTERGAPWTTRSSSRSP
jgi:glycosyltransferase involved in cell wall biosynthesis